ncbi:MAG: hypothetical protein AAF311_03755 [Pseudomonadota bacterium]
MTNGTRPDGGASSPLTVQCIYDAITKGQRLSGVFETFGPPGFDTAIAAAYPGRPEGALPPITRSHFQEPRRTPSYFALFETLSLAARKAYFTGAKTHPKGMETVEADVIRQAIIAFIHREEALNGLDGDQADAKGEADPKDPSLPSLVPVRRKPFALKLVGYHIEGDLDLSNLGFNGSLRLVGCVITGALILDRCEMVTLDLSGSVVKHGISGMYLTLRGALRCRRMVAESAIDLGGLSAAGTVDFTDAILSPENETSTRASYVRDRGILNLAQSELERDLRMERARIYGGINLRAARIGGMFHLNDALLRSPLAHFEYIVLKTLDLIVAAVNDSIEDEEKKLLDPRKRKVLAKEHEDWLEIETQFPQSLSQGAERNIAVQIHPDALNKPQRPLHLSETEHGKFCDVDMRRKWERLGKGVESETAIGGKSDLQRHLMVGDVATAESALRAEQLTVRGPIYARGLRTSGRIRMKHLQASGNLSLNGSRLRSAKDVRIGLGQLRDFVRSAEQVRRSPEMFARAAAIRKSMKRLGRRHPHLRNSYNAAAKIFSADGDRWLSTPSSEKDDYRSDYVIDLDHARIKGDVDFGTDARPSRTIKEYEKQLKSILQDLANELWKLYSYENETAAKSSIIKWFGESDSPPVQLSETVFKERLPLHFRKGSGLPSYNPTLIIGDVKLDNVVTEGSVYFRGTVFNPSRTYEPSRKKSIRARNAEIRLHMDLRESVGLNGLCLTSAKIGGSVRCYDLDLKDKTRSHPGLSNMAFCRPVFTEHHPLRNTEGQVFIDFDLNLARIGGSAFLTFHPEHGPNLTFEEGQVENQTYIFAPDCVFAARKPIEQRNDKRRKGERNKDQLLVFARVVLPGFLSRRLPKPGEREGEEKVSRRNPNAYPIVNLRGLSSPFLSHNPGAWPMPGFMVVRNLRYESTDDHGHLYPLARTKDSVKREHEENEKVHEKARPILWAALLLLFGLGHVLFGLNDYEPSRCYAGETTCLSSNTVGVLAGLVRAFGELNLFLMIAFCIILPVLQYWSEKIRPHERRAKPLAIFWLDCQQEHLNTRRTEHYILPTEPYIRAAAVLRAANRNTSAAAVERDRLRKRRQALSLFKAFPSRLLLKSFDFFMGYGFKPSRGVVLTVFYILGASLVFHGAKTNGVIVPSDIVDLYEERRVLGHNLSKRGPDTHNGQRDTGGQDGRIANGTTLSFGENDGRRSADVGVNQSCVAVLNRLSENNFHSLLFTLDSLVPFIDMDIEADWKVVDPDRFATILECRNDEHHHAGMLYGWVYLFAVFVKIIGWCLITALAFSLLTRFESLLIRSNT